MGAPASCQRSGRSPAPLSARARFGPAPNTSDKQMQLMQLPSDCRPFGTIASIGRPEPHDPLRSSKRFGGDLQAIYAAFGNPGD
jgi:hypothetical protein